MRGRSTKKIAGLLTKADRTFPLSIKFLLPFAILLSVVVATVAWIEYRVQRDQINDNYVQRGQVLARALTSILEDPNNSSDLEDTLELQEHIEDVLSLDPSVLRVNIYVPDAGGAITAGSSDTLLVGTRADAHDAEPLESGASEIEETRVEGEKALEISSPVRVDGNTVAALGVYTSLAEREDALNALAIRLVLGPIVAVAVAAGVVWLGLHLLVVRRLRWMVRSGERLGQGDMTARVAGRWEDPGRDEMAIAIHQFNSMAESIQSLTTTLEQLGMTDGLTGVYNRRFFDENLVHELKRGERTRGSVALLMLDIDHFKKYNDRFGHQAGDEALRRVAQALAREIRSIDVVARYGGEEFVVILPGGDGRTALAVAERVRSAVESAGIDTGGTRGGSLTVSVGVGVYPEAAHDAPGLVAAADSALYVAKSAGRNRVRAAEPVDARAPSVPR